MTDPAATQYAADEVEAARRGAFWWSLASNPPCQPWCDGGHDPHDFLMTGSTACSRALGCGVTVRRHALADDDVPFQVHWTQVVVDVAAREELDAEALRVLSQALASALAMLEELHR